MAMVQSVRTKANVRGGGHFLVNSNKFLCRQKTILLVDELYHMHSFPSPDDLKEGLSQAHCFQVPLTSRFQRQWRRLRRWDSPNRLRDRRCRAMTLARRTDSQSPKRRLPDACRSNPYHQWGSLSLDGRFGSCWGRDRASLQSIQEIEKPIRHWLGNDIGVQAA